MKSIRVGVFETNSSSTHSLTIAQKEEYEKWEKGELLLADGDTFVTKEEAIEMLKKDEWFNKRNPNFDYTDEKAVNEALRDNYYETSDEYFDDEYLEGYERKYTSKSGDELVIFGKYGHD